MYPNKYVSELIKNAVNKENADINFYNALSEASTDIDDKNLLKSICLDEEKHSKILNELYYDLNNSYPDTEEISEDTEGDFAENICRAIADTTKAVENYRAVLFALKAQQYKDMLTEIILDEQNHAAKLNYLYSKNK